MSSPTFAERFKDKSSTLSHTGQIAVTPGYAILKPGISQIHSPHPGSSELSYDTSLKTPHSSFYSNKLIPRNSIPHIQTETRSIKPYISPLNPDSPKLSPLSKESIIKSSILPRKQDLQLNISCDKKYFKPYSIQDYMKIKPSKYFKLGGLGANIGNDQWLNKKTVIDRRGTYAKSVNRGVKISNGKYSDRYKTTDKSPVRFGRVE